MILLNLAQAAQVAPQSPIDHLPVWIQTVIAIGVGLGAVIVGMIFAARKGIRLFSGGVSVQQFNELAKDLTDFRQECRATDAKVGRIPGLLHQLETRVGNRIALLETGHAVMRERQLMTDEKLKAVEAKADQLERRRWDRDGA